MLIAHYLRSLLTSVLSVPSEVALSAAWEGRPHGLTHVRDRQHLHPGDLA